VSLQRFVPVGSCNVPTLSSSIVLSPNSIQLLANPAPNNPCAYYYLEVAWVFDQDRNMMDIASWVVYSSGPPITPSPATTLYSLPTFPTSCFALPALSIPSNSSQQSSVSTFAVFDGHMQTLSIQVWCRCHYPSCSRQIDTAVGASTNWSVASFSHNGEEYLLREPLQVACQSFRCLWARTRLPVGCDSRVLSGSTHPTTLHQLGASGIRGRAVEFLVPRSTQPLSRRSHSGRCVPRAHFHKVV